MAAIFMTVCAGLTSLNIFTLKDLKSEFFISCNDRFRLNSIYIYKSQVTHEESITKTITNILKYNHHFMLVRVGLGFLNIFTFYDLKSRILSYVCAIWVHIVNVASEDSWEDNYFSGIFGNKTN